MARAKSITRRLVKNTGCIENIGPDFRLLFQILPASNLQESEVTKYGNYQSMRALNEIDCKNKKFRGLSVSFYEKNDLLGRVISSRENENVKWIIVGEGRSFDHLRK